MVILLKNHPEKKQLKALVSWLTARNLEIHMSEGTNHTILGLVGDTTGIDLESLKSMEIVEDVKRIQEPYKNANRKFHPADTVVNVGGVAVGRDFAIMAGPCSVESEEQICLVAERVKKGGANILRGGAFKPRTSPYAFQGLRGEGIRLLLAAKKATGLPIVTELMDLSHLDMFQEVDLIQVGARNMQNFELLKELGKSRKPVLLKRSMAATFQDWLMSAEYIMAGGNGNVILCERGIRTFETYTRNTMDISAIPIIKHLSHLPIIADPSHATGAAPWVKPMSLAAAAAGCHGLMIEVHNDPVNALCDGSQSVTPEAFEDIAKAVRAILPMACKE